MSYNIFTIFRVVPGEEDSNGAFELLLNAPFH
jgi:hypothetical protein